jgi:D-alanyl-D-alanine dipeptidase
LTNAAPDPDEPLVLLSDPRIAAIGMADFGEPLVNLRDVPELRLGGRPADRSGRQSWLRERVVLRLLDAQATLPCGLRFLITEGYRSLDQQQSVFDGYRDELRRRHLD